MALIGPLLPAERGRGCRPEGDNLLYFNGKVWMARTGAQWRQIPDEYGEWNSVFRRYHRWVVTGVFEAMLETLAAAVAYLYRYGRRVREISIDERIGCPSDRSEFV